MTEQVNSEVYWNTRFNSDWEAFEGPRQSTFFSLVALRALPRWLLAELKVRELTFADWGCAQGDGTSVFTRCVDASHITGIDFSPVAIAQAAQRYPHLTFKAQDWLSSEDDGSRYDVVFSSNTLEHFEAPFDALTALCRRARRAVVLALPYREYERIDEHFVTFDPDNIPLTLEGTFSLVWARVVDCKSLPDSMWGGEQIVLVYAERGWFDSLGLTLSEKRVEHDDLEQQAELARMKLTQVSAELTQVSAELTQVSAKLTQVTGELKQSRQASESRELEVQQTAHERDQEIQQLRAQMDSMSGQLAQVSAWAQMMDRSPFIYGMKRHVYRTAKAVYKALPISHTTRQRVRSLAFKVVGGVRRHLRPTTPTSNPIFEMPVVVDSHLYRSERDIFVFSVIDWHFRIQRPQHLARGFARMGRRVFFFSSSFADSDQPGYQIERLDPGLELYVVRLHVSGAPHIYFAQPTQAAQQMLQQGIAMLIGTFGATSSVSVLQHPYWFKTAFALPNSLRVYDCMDHHEGFGNVPAELIAAEKDMLRLSDLVVVTSGWLEAIARPVNHSVAVVRNAGEYSHFAVRPPEVFRDLQGRRVIGYYGAIAEWFDLSLVRAIALAHADCLVLLVGSDTVDAAKVLADVPNVRFTGEVPYAKLPFYLWGFDVCLLPFQVIPLTLATNPVKVYEYLASGKPVVAVDLPEIAQFGDLVLKAHGGEDFVRQVGQALAQPGIPGEVEARRTFAREQTWDHRVADIAEAIEALRLPKISVVVLTYNNLHLTQACLESLVVETDYPRLEIVVVDNASTDKTPTYLRNWQERHPEAKVILNKRNLGFAAGNNIGLSAATGDYLVILNNDTVVTRGWALTLLRHLQSDAQAGLVGPITNNIGNEARVETSYESLEGMKPQALRQTLAHMGSHFRIRTAAFFCVMLPRATLEACGLLCEEYGLGFFEDDDYCRMIEAQGYHSLCAEDVFVHHQLSASFSKLPSREREELFERNKAIYERKWGEWKAHTYERLPVGAVVQAPVAMALPAPSPAPAPASYFEGQHTISGTCCICGQPARFFFTDRSLWREQLNCSECLSTSRYRSVARGLLRAVEELAGVKADSLASLPTEGASCRVQAYDTQPPFYYLQCSYPLPDLLKKTGWIDVRLSQYKPTMQPGDVISQGVTNQNLEALTFEDGSLDIVVTSDVMEHVRLDAQAHSEIHRVLRRGGIYIFTVPHNLAWEDTLVRVQVTDPADPCKDAYLLEPEYHGDTNGDGSGVLSYRKYGHDLVTHLQSLGFEVEYTREDMPQLGILNTELFYCRKVTG